MARTRVGVSAVDGRTTNRLVACLLPLSISIRAFRPVRTRRVAELAALAVLMRPSLSRDAFETLYRPFAALIPMESLDTSPSSPVGS